MTNARMYRGIALHDQEVAEVVSEWSHEYWPDICLFEARVIAPPEADLLSRWEAEDKWEDDLAADDAAFTGLMAEVW